MKLLTLLLTALSHSLVVHAGKIDRILQLFVLLGRFLKLLLQASQLLFVLRLQLTKLVSEVGAEVVSLLFGLG